MDKSTIWSDAIWPKASSDKAFILDALNIVGTAMHGANWTGNEITACSWSLSPVEAERRRIEESGRRIANIKNAPRPAINVGENRRFASAKTAQVGATTRQAIDPQEFAERLRLERERRDTAIATEQEFWVRDGEAFQRLNAACEWLAQRCRDGDVKSFTRFTNMGGQPLEMPPGDWMNEPALAVFFQNGGYDRWFTTTTPPAKCKVYIFIDRASLAEAITGDTVLGRSCFIAPVETKGVHLSPYLRLMIDVIRDLEITPTNQLTKDVIEAHFENRWPSDWPTSRHLVGAMATLIREISSQKGRANKG